MENRSKSVVYLALGSNIGDRAEYLSKALGYLKKITNEPIVCSSIYDSDPLGPLPQTQYLNMCVQLTTDLTPLALLDFCKKTEAALGRIHRVKWGPREIDIDILFYSNMPFNHLSLTIPHPEIINRPFVFVPLSEIAGHLTVPGTQISFAQFVDQNQSPAQSASLSVYREKSLSPYASAQTY